MKDPPKFGATGSSFLSLKAAVGRHTTFIFSPLARLVSVKERPIKSVHLKVTHASLTNILIFIVSNKFILVAPKCVDNVNLTEYEAGSHEVKLLCSFLPTISTTQQQRCTFVQGRFFHTSDSHQTPTWQILK